MEKLRIFAYATVLGIFCFVAINQVVQENRQVKLKSIEVKSLSSDIDQLNLRYDKLNEAYQEATHEKKVNQKKVDEISEQKRTLEEEKRRLEAELQAKKEAKSKIASASSAVLNKVTGTATAYASDGSQKEQWMAAAGIPQSDWYYVDCVINGCEGVSAEGGWSGTTRWNTAGSGAYGLCQALPGSKMASAGADWETNPVTQLKWCHSYAQAYGGWQQAWQFRKCLGSCYSSRTNSTVSKDHTWW